MIPDNGTLRYKGVWDYCHRKDCIYYKKCGLAVTPRLRAESIIKKKPLSKKVFCVSYKTEGKKDD